LYILGSNFLKSEPVPIDKEGKVFAETIKTILTPLWNAYHFFTLYANAGDITAKINKPNNENILDKYILSELNSLQNIVKESLNEYKPDVAVKEFTKFLDILNNWYIRLNRERFWDEDQTAFDTLHYVLTELCKLMAPFAPFVSDYIYKNLSDGKSVHMCEFAKSEKSDDSKLLEDMRRVQLIVSTGKQLREQFKLRNRLPLAKITIAGKDMKEYSDIIKDELNVKSVDFIEDISSVADSFVYPITPKIGARLGSALKEIIPAIKQGKYKVEDNKLVV